MEFKQLSDFEKREVEEKIESAIKSLKNAKRLIGNDWMLSNLHLARISLAEAIFEAEKNCYMCQSSRNIDDKLNCARKFKEIENAKIFCCDDFEKGEIVSGM